MADAVRTLGRGIARAAVFVFLKIEEPRVKRTVYFAMYLTLTFLGGVFLADPPRNFEGVLGIVLAIVFGSAVFGGGLLGALAVLPGIWWVERLSIIALWTGLSMYVVVAITLGASSIGIAIAIWMMLSLVVRWLDVREYQLAPGR